MSDDLRNVIHALETRVAELEAQRRPPRKVTTRRLRRVAVGLLAVALLVPGVVLASHQFTDVPNSHIFHNDIDWLADSGVTGGCGGGNFCPNASVTRGQMAAFMHRLSNEFEIFLTSTNPGPGTTFFKDATCPAGMRVVAGGGGSDRVDVFMTSSRPNINSWRVEFATDNNAIKDPDTIEAYVLCAPRR
jgi:hypothetical protein